jgi:hypothetical protein
LDIITTVKPGYNDLPRAPKVVAVVDRWSLAQFWLYLVKFVYGGLELGSNQFLLHPPAALNIWLASKVVKSDSKV